MNLSCLWDPTKKPSKCKIAWRLDIRNRLIGIISTKKLIGIPRSWNLFYRKATINFLIFNEAFMLKHINVTTILDVSNND